jgi:hypothetical protein
MKLHQPREETGRVLAVAAALWGTVVAVAALDGALTRFDVASLASLTAFVSLFAAASFLLDPQLRAYAARMDRLRAAALALGLAGAFVAALALESVPFAMFLAPLATLALAGGGLRLRRLPRSAAPAKSPGATPAAT